MDLWKSIVGQNWAFYTHQKLYDMVRTEARGAAAVEPADQAWQRFAALMAESKEDIEQALKEAGASWEGLAADAMTSGVTPLAQWADDADTAGTASGTGVRQVGAFFAFTSTAMPEPAPAATDPAGIPSIFPDLFDGQTDADQREREAQQAKLRAVELMKGYSKNALMVLSQLGTFIPPQSVTVAVAPPQLAGGSIHQATGGFTVPAPNQSAPASAPQADPPEPESAAVGRPTVSSGPLPVAPAPARDGETRPGAAATPSPAPAPSNALAQPPGGGLAPASGFAGVSGGGSTWAPIAGQRRGRTAERGGGPGAASPEAPADRASATRNAGGRGAAGAVGVGPFGTGAPVNRDEDTEHALPDYLLGYHDEFWDDGSPGVPPPVIGGDDSTDGKG